MIERPVRAVVEMSTTLIAMIAPTATPSPAALASPVVVVEPSCEARTATEPVTSQSAPVPIRAMVSCCTIVIATPGATAVPPFAPAATFVTTVSVERASTVTSWPPEIVAPSSISARVALFRTGLIAIEAPTPVEAPPSVAGRGGGGVGAEVLGPARSPVPTARTAEAGMTAWVVPTTLRKAPATLTSVEPEPDLLGLDGAPCRRRRRSSSRSR